MKKRLLSALLALVMVAGLLPAATFSGFAAAGQKAVDPNRVSSVEYTAIVNSDRNDRENYYLPEVAILNYYTGNSQDFYDSLKGSGELAQLYNAIVLFGGRWYDWKVSHDFSNSETWTWTGINWENETTRLQEGKLSNTGLGKQMLVPNNLEIGVSATATNNHHTHTKKNYKVSVTTYESIKVSVTGTQVLSISAGDTSEVRNSLKPRIGDLNYEMINGFDQTIGSDDNPSDDLQITFSVGGGGYYVKGNIYQCSCSTSAEDIVITFRDAKAPKVSAVEYSTDGTNFTSNGTTTRVVEGDTLYIKLAFDEAIRFADDDATGMEDLYIELLQDRETSGSGRKAYLYKVDGKNMYFKYAITGEDRYENITSIDTGSLFTPVGVDASSGSIPLVQVGKFRAFTVGVPSDALDGSNGFTTSKCYITDIAGNAMQERSISGANLIIDTETPYVDEVSFSAGTNNASLKAYLCVKNVPVDDVSDSYLATNPETTVVNGVTCVKLVPKDQLIPGSTSYAQSYADTSDTYLGVGDSLSMTIKMNERLKLNLYQVEYQGKMYPRLNWDFAYATTNILAPAGYTGHTTQINGKTYVDIRAAYMTPYTYSDKSDDPTVFRMGSLVITEGMTVDTTDNENGEIKVIGFHFDFDGASGGDAYKSQLIASGYITAEDDSIMDLAGNKLDNDNVRVKSPTSTTDPDTGATVVTGEDANQNPYRLDLSAPVVTGGSYTPLSAAQTGTLKGFLYTFTLGYDADSGETMNAQTGMPLNCSEYLDVSGSFILTSGDGACYDYQYAVKAAGESQVSESDWKDATTGVPMSFTQTATVNLYIRPKQDAGNGEATYDLHGCTLIVSACDYAGNVMTVTLPKSETGADSTFEWYIDTTPPTITGGETTRELVGGVGNLTAQVNLSDSNGISNWEYAWTNSADTKPAESAWVTGGGISDNSATAITVYTVPSEANGGVVAADEQFGKYLWVRATDNSDNYNVRTECLGLYTYDLRTASYGLTYTSGTVTESADVKINSLSDEDALIFMISSTGILRNPGENEYFVLIVKGTDSGILNRNIFDLSGWRCYDSVTVTDGIYSFGSYDQDGTDDLIAEQFRDGAYRGNAVIQVISGKLANLSETAAGDESYRFAADSFTLKLTGVNPQYNYTYTVSPDTTFITLTGPETMEKVILESNKDYWYRDVTPQLLSTLEGIGLTITIPQDNNGWACEDIDWASSKIILTNHTDGSTYEVNIRPFRADQSGQGALATQTVTLPAAGVAGGTHGDTYTTGTYTAKLELHFVNSAKTLDVPYSEADTLGHEAQFVVDATEMKSDFAITSISYGVDSLYYSDTVNMFGMNDSEVYGEKSFIPAGDGVIYLPVAAGDLLNRRAANYHYRYGINITVPGEVEPEKVYSKDSGSDVLSWTGLYLVRMWNKAYPDNKVTLKPDEDDPTLITNEKNVLGSSGAGFAIDETVDGLITLDSDEVNEVVLEKVYSNGKTSTVTVKIMPVKQQLTGKLSIGYSTGELVFTPDDMELAMSMDAPEVYAFAYDAATQDYTKNEGQRIRMTLNADGTWRCPLVENGATYRVFTVNDYASAWSDSLVFASERAPWLYDDDTEFTDHGDGTYTLTFELRDDYNSMADGWPKINIGFADSYCTDSMTLLKENFENDWSASYRYTWTCGDQASPTGIYAIEVAQGNYDWNIGTQDNSINFFDYLTVTVHGVFLTGSDGDMGLTIRAEDNMGNSMSEAVTATANYVAPAVTDTELTEEGLKLTFSQPVAPVESWAWHEDDRDWSYGTEWSGSFPITANGTYDVSLRDVTGAVQVISGVTTQAFTVDGKNWGITIDWSETALTREAVSITATMIDPFGEDDGLMFHWLTNVGTEYGSVMVPEGTYNGTETTQTAVDIPGELNGGRFYTDSLGWSIYNKYATSTPRTVSVTESGTIKISVYDRRYSETKDLSDYVYRMIVHVDNIAAEAPEAEIDYYAQSLGRHFTYEELEAYVGAGKTLAGTVVASYTTSRSVIPVEETGTSFTFDKDNYAAVHIFKYEDDISNRGSAEARLPAGLTLTEDENAQEKVDTKAPVVNAAVYKKVAGVYTRAESFTAAQENATLPADLFTEMGAAQAYRLMLNVTDDSGYEITVSQAEGVTLDSGVITITQAADFTVTITDKADVPNVTSFTITRAMLSALDTTPPEVKSVTVTGALYEKTINIEFEDDKGGEVTLISPTGATALGGNRYAYTVRDNGNVTFVFRDEAGNQNTCTQTIEGLDVEPPTLTVTWSPPAGADRKDIPTSETVNTDVTALIASNKAMYGLSVSIGQGEAEIPLLTAGAATGNNPYVIPDPNDPAQALITITAYPERIVVSYHGQYWNIIRFTATAPNGKSTQLELDTMTNVLNIDKTAPMIQTLLEPLYRQKADGSSYSVAYAVKATMTPDELVISHDYGASTTRIDPITGETVTEPKQYGLWGEPLVVTFTGNGTYQVHFVDLAGNMTVETVDITGIDRTAPTITLGEVQRVQGGDASVSVAVNEACTVTVDGRSYELAAGTPRDIAFTENGSYLIVATDRAGNESTAVAVVGVVDKILPSISFVSNTIYLMQDSSFSELDDALSSGFTIWDNVTQAEALVLNVDASQVDLTVGGMYTVVYTITDEAGNTAQANRFVQVVGKDTVCVEIDGKLIMPGSTAVITPNEQHTIRLRNSNEPFVIKARSGNLALGQMKYLTGSSLSFDVNGNFTVDGTGFYTLLVTTQSRKTIRVLLYVE